MNPVYFLRPKGVVTILFGLLILIAPAWLMTLMGAEVGAAGEAMIRLFGLPLLVMGYGMVTTAKDAQLDQVDIVLTIICEFSAVAIMFFATQAGAFNVLGYVLAAIYVGSGCGFLYCFFAAKKQRAEVPAS